MAVSGQSFQFIILQLDNYSKTIVIPMNHSKTTVYGQLCEKTCLKIRRYVLGAQKSLCRFLWRKLKIFYLFPSWCKWSLLVSSLTLNLEANSWQIRHKSDSTAAFKPPFFRDIGLPAGGSSSRFHCQNKTFETSFVQFFHLLHLYQTLYITYEKQMKHLCQV